ncbi:Relaxase/Mobilisation nuclease domain-containing protein [Roseovarius tolerans]|uniref:Relaxase/Mobilisation nuclease domain-containing protein n=1 Tax=Roseovarius tolerans TaxID=74031 RepID=A0A1H8JGX7_9RHOB|nr:relaxase/mobilization nuclease domain-containing protein [Roseovarius tolerans]SEN80044.1 Relaxase/Mobilisation nuclease domain-containing protein [Roseovarius tolerans]
MIPRVGPGGASFQGAGLYYLHDKDALTSERVAFTHTLNTHTDSPDRSLKVMAWTAMHQSEMKQAAGVKATGRKLEKPVYTYSLAWAQDETPTREEMVTAAQGSLKALGMEDQQAVLVAHKDTQHPHIHVILNRVHPENGKAASTSKDHLKLSKWAEGYERGQGKIRVQARVNHNARREKGQFVKNENITREEYDWVKQHRSLDPSDIREARSTRQTKESAELKGSFTRRQNRLEASLRREYARPRAKLDKEIGATEERIGKKGLFRAVVRKLTGAEKRDQASVASLRASRQGIETRMDERRDELKQGYARDWEKMERRHVTERERDELLIERKRSEGSRGRAGEVARKTFRVRAGSETAQHSPAPSDRARMAQALDKAARKAESDDGGKTREVSEDRIERAKRRAEGAKRSRNRPRNKGQDKDFERD